MKFKNILTYFYFALVTSIVLRTYQIFFTIDNVTGFFKPEYKGIGAILLLVLGAIAISVFILSITVHRRPLKLPKVSFIDGAISFILGISIFLDTFASKASASIPEWQFSLLTITGSLAGIFFCLYAFKCIKETILPSFTYIIPVLYGIIRLIYSFTAISSLALISKNILLIATNAFVLLFMFEFAKIANNLDTEKSYKKILCTGLTASLLSAISAIPQVLAIISNKVSHTEDKFTTLCTLFTSIFIYRLIRTHFSGRNLKRHRRHRSSVKFMPGDGGNNFYTGNK